MYFYKRFSSAWIPGSCRLRIKWDIIQKQRQPVLRHGGAGRLRGGTVRSPRTRCGTGSGRSCCSSAGSRTTCPAKVRLCPEASKKSRRREEAPLDTELFLSHRLVTKPCANKPAASSTQAGLTWPRRATFQPPQNSTDTNAAHSPDPAVSRLSAPQDLALD